MLPRPSRELTPKSQSTEPATTPVERPKPKAKDFRPSDIFKFDPLPDITVAELAYLLMVLYEPAIHFKSYLNLPEDVRRHFRSSKA